MGKKQNDYQHMFFFMVFFKLKGARDSCPQSYRKGKEMDVSKEILLFI